MSLAVLYCETEWGGATFSPSCCFGERRRLNQWSLDPGFFDIGWGHGVFMRWTGCRLTVLEYATLYAVKSAGMSIEGRPHDVHPSILCASPLDDEYLKPY